MSDEQTTDDFDDEDGWWEMVFSAKDQLNMDRACDSQCLTQTCQCRSDAISRVSRDTGVNYDV